MSRPEKCRAPASSRTVAAVAINATTLPREFCTFSTKATVGAKMPTVNNPAAMVLHKVALSFRRSFRLMTTMLTLVLSRQKDQREHAKPEGA
jgi:hypothetical protein